MTDGEQQVQAQTSEVERLSAAHPEPLERSAAATSDAALFVTPTRYRSGPEVLPHIGPEAAQLADRVLVAHGEVGWRSVGHRVEASFAGAGIAMATQEHRGYVTSNAIATLADAARAANAGALVAVGGGRVLDAGKAAADRQGIPCLLVPTSPATCSGATAVVVDYGEAGGYLGSRRTTAPPAAAVVDTRVLAEAPDRLLVAGLVDALAKSVEVLSRSAAGQGAAAAAAYALAREMSAWIWRYAEAAVGAGPDEAVRQEAAELAVLWPGLVGGLASEAAKLAAAHPIHNALTHEPRDPAVRRAIHGEILAYGILVQLVLQGEPDEAARHAGLFARLGCPADLEALGFGAVARDPEALGRTATRAAAMAPLRAAFPGADAHDVAEAMRAADAVAAEAAATVSNPTAPRPG